MPTIPATVPAAALPPHTPDIANGRTMFEIGGCTSCHATSANALKRWGEGLFARGCQG